MTPKRKSVSIPYDLFLFLGGEKTRLRLGSYGDLIQKYIDDNDALETLVTTRQEKIDELDQYIRDILTESVKHKVQQITYAAVPSQGSQGLTGVNPPPPPKNGPPKSPPNKAPVNVVVSANLRNDFVDELSKVFGVDGHVSPSSVIKRTVPKHVKGEIENRAEYEARMAQHMSSVKRDKGRLKK